VSKPHQSLDHRGHGPLICHEAFRSLTSFEQGNSYQEFTICEIATHSSGLAPGHHRWSREGEELVQPSSISTIATWSVETLHHKNVEMRNHDKIRTVDLEYTTRTVGSGLWVSEPRQQGHVAQSDTDKCQVESTDQVHVTHESE
jgi:hypothetical protein